MSQEREPGYYLVRHKETRYETIVRCLPPVFKGDSGWWLMFGIGTRYPTASIERNYEIVGPCAAQAVAAHAREPDEAMATSFMESIKFFLPDEYQDWQREAIKEKFRAALAAIGPGRSDRDAVIEECAQWHDKQREAWLDQARNAQRLSRGGDEAEAQEYRQQHERYAAYAIIHRQSAEELRRGKSSPEKPPAPTPLATHGSSELDEEAAKLIALGADPGPTFADACGSRHPMAGER